MIKTVGGDFEVPDGVVLSEADGSHDGDSELRVRDCGLQEVLVLEELTWPCLEIGVAPDAVKQGNPPECWPGFQ